MKSKHPNEHYHDDFNLNDSNKSTYNPTEKAYHILVNIFNTNDTDKEDLLIAIEEAIGYLGEALDN